MADGQEGELRDLNRTIAERVMGWHGSGWWFNGRDPTDWSDDPDEDDGDYFDPTGPGPADPPEDRH